MNFTEAQKACQKDKSVLLVFDSRGEVSHTEIIYVKVLKARPHVFFSVSHYRGYIVPIRQQGSPHFLWPISRLSPRAAFLAFIE
jgi:hypothetical protein